ncbi:signal peptidase I [Streptococcus caviae]|uniref:signal peptidase I n=1 Tax=Streptococcus sp. 'caviae' TaxID=1915004 RepID=UPI00094B9BF0|nr:signal peptidase I [Streptococcus sp. 'caviae']OLN82590.1 signal peptidase I [Streptococcus sp. 'caviae']
MVKRDFIRNILLAVLAVCILLLLRIFVFSTYRVRQDDVNSYLKAGDLITISKKEKPDYKDFVVYQADGKSYIGRIIGEPEDRITYMDDIFYLNNKVEGQSYIEKLKSSYHAKNGDNPFTADFTIATVTKGKYQEIPKGRYLILNDNRTNTKDSRTFGLIKKSQIKGVVTFRILPLKTFGFVKKE